MPNPPYALTWALDEPMSSNPASDASSASRETHQPSQTVSSTDLARLETVFKALLDAQEERLKRSIHKRIQTLLDKIQESHAKVIDAAEAVLKDRKKDRAEQVRMSVAPQPLPVIAPAPVPLAGGPSKGQWDALMDEIQWIHGRLDFLTDRFAGVADGPPDGSFSGDTQIPLGEPSGGDSTGDMGVYTDANMDVEGEPEYASTEPGGDESTGDMGVNTDADMGAEGEPEYASTESGVVGDVSSLTTSDDTTPVHSAVEPLALPYHQSPPPDPTSPRSETTPVAPDFHDTSTRIKSYQFPDQQYYPSPISQANTDNARFRDMSMSQEPTLPVDQRYPFQAIDSGMVMGAYSDAFSSGESSLPTTVRLQDVELIPRIASTSSLSSLSSLSTISPQPVTGKRRPSPSRTPTRATGDEKRRRGASSLKSSSISWPKLIPHKPGMTPQRIYCDGCQRWCHLECVGMKDGDEICDVFLCPLCETFGLGRALRLSKRRTSTANETCIRPNCPQKRRGREVKKEAEREFLIEGIVGRRGVRPNFEYLVKWDGYSIEHCEWKSPSEFRTEILLPSFEKEAAAEGIDLSRPTGTHFLSEAREFWGQFKIERIVGRRPGPYSKHEYLCKWLGWGVECSEWKPEQDFVHEGLVEEFEHAARHEQLNPRNSADTILLSEAQIAWGNAPASKYFPLASVRFLLKDEKDATVF